MIEERHYYGLTYNADYLEHHGILGQKWGRRRFQNQDGSLTPAGKERYSREDFDSDEEYETAKKEAITSGDATKVNAWKRELTNKELNDAINRINMEDNLANLQPVTPSNYDKAMEVMKKTNAAVKEVATLSENTYKIVNNTENIYKRFEDYAKARKAKKAAKLLESDPDANLDPQTKKTADKMRKAANQQNSNQNNSGGNNQQNGNQNKNKKKNKNNSGGNNQQNGNQNNSGGNDPQATPDPADPYAAAHKFVDKANSSASYKKKHFAIRTKRQKKN